MLLELVIKSKTDFCVFLLVLLSSVFCVKRRNSVFRFYKNSSTFPRVVWAEVSESGLGIKIGPLQQKL